MYRRSSYSSQIHFALNNLLEYSFKLYTLNMNTIYLLTIFDVSCNVGCHIYSEFPVCNNEPDAKRFSPPPPFPTLVGTHVWTWWRWFWRWRGGGAIQLAFYQILFINYLHSIAKGTCVSIFTFHDIFHYKKKHFQGIGLPLWAGYAQVTRHLSF